VALLSICSISNHDRQIEASNSSRQLYNQQLNN